jgi:translation initiation factor IF-3
MYVNQAIKAPKITLIGEDGENLGLMSRDEAFRIADQKGYDLLQLSYNPNDMISTAKLIEDI